MKELGKREVYKCASYDKNQVEVYLLFSQFYVKMDAAKKEETRNILKRVLDFEYYRNREWRLLFFRSENDVDENEFFEYAKLKARSKPQPL